MKQPFGFRLSWIACGICWLAQAPGAFATPGQVADSPTITGGIGCAISNPETISPAKTTDGYTIAKFCDAITAKAGYLHTTLQISGFSSNPGQNWLVSAGTTAITWQGSQAVQFSYLNGTATWDFGTGGPAFYGHPQPAHATIVHGGDVGYLNMKFQVMAVDYAPPGAQSSVNYGMSAMRGTATNNSKTFSSSVTVTVTGDVGVNFFGIVEGGLTGSTSTAYSQQSGSNSTISVQTTASNAVIVKGPSSSAVGVNHDADVIWVWVNPLAVEYLGPNNTVAWGGYAWNGADDAQEMEVIPLYVGWLKNPSTMDPAVAARLRRAWDQTGLGGLTAADYAQILQADPFATSSSYNPSADTGHRFDMVSGSTIPYVPASPGFQPVTWQGSIATQQTSSQGQSASHTYKVGFTLDWSSKVDWVAEVASDIKLENTYQWDDSWSNTINSQTGKTASYSITGPASTDHYTGPVSFQVWRDNIYGSFMFYPVQ